MAIVAKVLTPSNSGPIAEQNGTSAATAVLSPPQTHANAWRTAGIWVVLASLAALALFRETAWLIVNTWESSRSFSHCFLIVPIFLYLVWVRRGPLLALRPKPNYGMLLAVALLAAVWLAGSMGDVNVVKEFALVALLEAIIWVVLGTAVVRLLWFPLLFLFFAVPFGESAIGPLQDFTAHFAVVCLRLTHVPAILENRTIWVPTGPWVVAEACSGIRYLISSLVLGLVYASLIYRSRRRRALFVLASIVVPIIANGIRAYGIILLADLTNDRLAVGVDHIIYGFVFFTLLQLLLFSVGLKWREAGWSEPVKGTGDSTEPMPKMRSPRTFAAAALSAVVVAGLAPSAQGYLWKRAAGPSPQPILLVNAPWHATAPYGHGWTPMLHPSSELTSGYANSEHAVDVYVANYSGRLGVELVSGYNQFSNPREWTEVAGGYRTVTVNQRSTRVRWDVIQSASGERLVWTWYWAGETPTANDTAVKLAQTKARLLGRPTTITVMTVSAGFLRGPAEAAEQLQDFLNHSNIVLTSAPDRR